MKKTKCVPDTFQQIQSVDLKSDQQFVLLPPLYYTFFLLGETVACYNEHGTVYVSINAHKCTEEYAALWLKLKLQCLIFQIFVSLRIELVLHIQCPT